MPRAVRFVLRPFGGSGGGERGGERDGEVGERLPPVRGGERLESEPPLRGMEEGVVGESCDEVVV